MTNNKDILKSLTEAHGVAGYEAPVRALVRELFESLGDLSQDKLGSVICKKAGSTDAPRVMLAGHMDEIGQMVKLITKDGFLKFLTLGGWFSQVLLGQRVIVQTNKGDIPGIIGAKPPHLLPAEERKKVVQIKDMYIDVGVSSKEEAEALGIRQGDKLTAREFCELLLRDGLDDITDIYCNVPVERVAKRTKALKESVREYLKQKKKK